ncbi:MAG: N-acetylglucosamine-6-phosphate deacetylase [Micromonosporaceae bacterium]|nr:N-acetylglucosamine-6-phosphate deacetylase [Micromonosporaceae bacterium]
MIVSGRVVTPERVLAGFVRLDGDRIAEVGPGAGGDQLIVPGFVDLHNHGGGGHSFTTGDPDAARGAARFHRRHGTTTLLASLVSSPYPLMRAATEAYAPLVAEGVLAGVHFEGPYLSPVRRGAQDPAHLRDPSTDELAELIALGNGTVRMVTLAPERAGALAAIRLLGEAGVVAAIGHTDASYEQTRAAVAAGATVATHLCNGMRPVHHREPGPVVALLGASDVVCELIADGVHLHDGMLAFAAGAAAGRAALVTDAMAAAGMPDGAYELGGQSVVVADRVARLTTADGDPGPIAGSTLTMDAALRRAVGAGVSLVDAVRMAATTPARVLGLAGTAGALAPGLRADLVVLDPHLRVLRVMRSGTWVA